MKRADVTYGQLDRALRAFGFSCRRSRHDPPGRIYEHPKTGAVVMLPDFPDTDRVYEHHLLTARVELENFGLADARAFAAKLQKAG
jgi:hypothetical protein